MGTYFIIVSDRNDLETYMRTDIDVKAIVKMLGGPTKTARLLKDLGVDVAPVAVRRWCERGSVRSTHLANLFTLATQKDRHFDPMQFLVRAD